MADPMMTGQPNGAATRRARADAAVHGGSPPPSRVGPSSSGRRRSVVRRWGGWWRADEGSVAAEITLLAPVLIMLLVFVAVVVHRGVDARLRLDDAAHQAARAASIERTSSAADTAARATATGALAADVACVALDVAVDTARFRPGGAVAVTVSCTVDLSDALIVGVPGQVVLTATAAEPVDLYRALARPADGPR